MILKFMLLFFVMPAGILSGGVDFRDCGSNFQVKKVSVKNCNHQKCKYPLGSEIPIEVSLLIDSQVTSAVVDSYISQRGMNWPLEVKPRDLCSVWKCPIQCDSFGSQEIIYNGTVFSESTLLKGPSDIFIRTKGENFVIACISFRADLT